VPVGFLVAAVGISAIGAKIYLFGVADFFRASDAQDADFHSEAGREGDSCKGARAGHRRSALPPARSRKENQAR